ncbi:restriction endonuclease [Pseudomonadota bacterium]
MHTSVSITSEDLSQLTSREQLSELLQKHYPENKKGRTRNWVRQIWPFAHEMAPRDWVVLPSKTKSAIHIGEITGSYVNSPELGSPYFHYHTVNWFAPDIPRSNFDQDILYSFGALLTICRIERNDAESRVRRMAQNNWKASSQKVPSLVATDEDAEQQSTIDLEEVARDQIAKLVISNHFM